MTRLPPANLQGSPQDLILAAGHDLARPLGVPAHVSQSCKASAVVSDLHASRTSATRRITRMCACARCANYRVGPMGVPAGSD